MSSNNNSNSNIVFSFVPSAITRPFFELQTPDFAWMFVGLVQTNYKSTKSTKKVCKYKINHHFGHCSSL